MMYQAEFSGWMPAKYGAAAAASEKQYRPQSYADYKRHKAHKKGKMTVQEWYAPYTTASASQVYCSCNVGGNVWCQQGTGSVTTANSDAIHWYLWPNVSVTTTGISVIAMGSGNVTYNLPETPEQRIERERHEAEAKAKEDAATKRAEELLFLLLTDAQRNQYEARGYFETLINDKVYRINKGRAMNVELIEGGVPKFKYCALPKDYMPAPDVMAAQLLMLQTDEQRFLAIANRTVLHPAPPLASDPSAAGPNPALDPPVTWPGTTVYTI